MVYRCWLSRGKDDVDICMKRLFSRACMQGRESGRDGSDCKAGSQELVIPAKAGIQEGDAGMLDSPRLSLNRNTVPDGHSRLAGMYG